MTERAIWPAVLVVVILSGFTCLAQQNATGVQPFGSFAGGPEVINLGNLDASWDIPILHKAGRGIPFAFDLAYDSSMVWTPVTSGGTTTWTPQLAWGWPASVSAVGYIPAPTSYQYTIHCTSTTWQTITNRIYAGYMGGPHNTLHPVSGLTTQTITGDPSCAGGTNGTATTADGYTISIPYGTTVKSATVTTKSGTSFTVPIGAGVVATLAKDTNGNKVTVNTSTGDFFDTLSSSTAVLNVSGVSPSPVYYTYTAPSGGSVFVKVTYKSYPVQTHFLCTGVTDYGASSPISNYLVDKITYPDGSFYQFSYEPTTTGSANVTGRIASVTLPTGGTISYAYTGSHGGINCADGTTMGFNRTTPDTSTAWQYNRSGTSPNWTTTVTDPNGKVTTYTFYQVTSTTTFGTISQSTFLYLETNRAATGLTILTCYNGNYSGCSSSAVSWPISQIDKYVTMNASQTSASETLFDTANGGRITETKQYDFGVSTGSAPSNTYLLKDSTIGYATLSGIIDHPHQITVLNKAGTTIARTYFTYDETTPTGTTGTPQHDPPLAARGNATTVISLVAGTNTLTTTASYYDTGNINVMTEPNGAITTYKYGSGTSCGNSFPTEVDLPMSLTTYSTWNCTGGVALSSKDVNGNTTTYQYTDPNYWRVTQITFPDSASDTDSFVYTNGSSSSWQVQETRAISSTQNITTTSLLDSLGRPYMKETSDPAAPSGSGGYSHVATSYDNLGRLYTITTPYYTTSDETYGVTTYYYDALSRTTQIANPYNHKSFTYTARATQVVDESGITKVYQMDGLGRLASVCEVMSATQQGSAGTPGSCAQDIAATGFLTSYTYDPLGNLLSVTQPGVNSRSYQYDGLSRLTQEINPESGTTIYVYDTGSAGDLYTRTRFAANHNGTTCPTYCTTTTYSYDALHRPTQVQYSDGTTPTVTLQYDLASYNGWTLTNSLGRLSRASTSAGPADTFSYDVLGRVLDDRQCTPLNCGTSVTHLTYAYNYAGEITSFGDPVAGATYTYNYDSNARLSNIQSTLYSPPNYPSPLFTVPSGGYNALGEINSATLGNGIARAIHYDQLGRPVSLQDGPSGSQYSYALWYTGNLMTAADDSNGNWSYTYDDFGRLATSCSHNGTHLCTGSSPNPLQAFSYQYDPAGNRWKQNVTAGTGTSPSYTFDSNNRISGSGITYDSPGNVNADGLSNIFVYDAENRAISVDSGSVTYTYDAFGRRVEQKISGTQYDYVYGPNGVADLWTSGGTLVWAQVAGRNDLGIYGNSTTTFYHQNWLGTMRSTSDASGNPLSTCTDYAFGDGMNCTSYGPGDIHYTGQEWDGNVSVTHFPMRNYSMAQGRWMHADPAGLAAVNPSDPQTWNRYAYVGNNPVTYSDPSGLVATNPGFAGLSRGMGFFASGGGNFVSGCTQDGIDSNCILNQTLQQAGATSTCLYSPCVGEMGLRPDGTPAYIAPGIDGENGFSVCGSVGPADDQSYDCDEGTIGGDDSSVLLAANNGNFSWWGAFAKNLFSWKNFTNEFKQGGCVNVAVNATAGALNPFSPSLATAGEATAGVLAASQYNAAVAYAASAPNYLGGTGLIYPMKSSVVRGMIADANATAAEAPLFAVDGALLQGVIAEGISMANGECH